MPSAIATHRTRFDHDELDAFEDALPDLRGYSLARALRNAAAGFLESREKLPGLEGEVSQELARRTGRNPRGFYVPPRAPIGRRAFDTGTGAGGIPTVLSPTIIDLLRAKSVLAGLGATVFDDLRRGKFAMPRRTATCSLGWFAEGAGPGATAEPKIDEQALFTPKTTGAYVDISNRLFVSLPNAGDVVAADLIAAIGTEIDRVALVGAGAAAEEPEGLFTLAGIPEIDPAAADYATVVAMEQLLANNNADVGALGWVASPDARAALRTAETATGSGRFVWPDAGPGPLGYRGEVTTNLDPSMLALGRWSELMVGMWGPIDVLVDIYKFSTIGYIRVRALADVDVEFKHLESFVRASIA